MLSGAATTGQAVTPAAGRPPGLAVTGPGRPRRLVAAAYRGEQEAPDKVLRLGSGDRRLSLRLPGVPRVRAPGRCPARPRHLRAAVRQRPVRGPAAGARGRAPRPVQGQRGRAEPRRRRGRLRPSSASRPGTSTCGKMPAAPPPWPRSTSGSGAAAQTSVAFTCLESVADRLTAAGVPVWVIRPTGSAIRAALRTATLLGGAPQAGGGAAGDRRWWRCRPCREAARRPAPRQSPGGAAADRAPVPAAGGRSGCRPSVSPVGDHTFLVTCHARVAGGAHRRVPGAAVLPSAPAASWASPCEVGVGLGRTAQEAEAHARAALRAAAHAAPGARGSALDREGTRAGPVRRARPPRPASSAEGPGDPVPARRQAVRRRTARTWSDAETAGRLLGVTPRTARRLLHILVEEGLAWPLPPTRTPQPGRPRQFYRLVTEKVAHRPSQ